MPESYKILGKGTQVGSVGQMYAPAAGVQAVVKEMTFLPSPPTTPTTFSVSAGAAPAKTMIPTTPLASGEWAEWQGSLALGPGDALSLTVLASTAVDWIVSGVEITP